METPNWFLWMAFKSSSTITLWDCYTSRYGSRKDFGDGTTLGANQLTRISFSKGYSMTHRTNQPIVVNTHFKKNDWPYGEWKWGAFCFSFFHVVLLN